MDDPIHDFLVTDGCLSKTAEAIPRIREYVSELPKTAGTFKLADIDGVRPQTLDTVHVEFAGVWRLSERYAQSSGRNQNYVNPNTSQPHAYSDIFVECECGTLINHEMNDYTTAVRRGQEHADDCLPHQRKQAEAELHMKRYKLFHRLSALGWKGRDIAPRFGIKGNDVGSTAKQYHLSLRDLYDVYRQLAGATYRYLVRTNDASGLDVAEVYGHSRSALSKWATKYDTVTMKDSIPHENGVYEWE